MRITGRILRPSDLAERRLMLNEFGTLSLRSPRGVNPYVLARRLRRAAHRTDADLLFVKEKLSARRPKPMGPEPSPDIDIPEPIQRPLEHEDGTSSREAA